MAATALVCRAQQPTAPHVVLTWQTPVASGCTSADQMQEKVARLTSRTFVSGDARADYHIQGLVSQLDPSWQARVTLLDHAGRTLGVRAVRGRSPDCGSVDVAAAVVIATLLDGLPAQAPDQRTPAAEGGGWSVAAFAAASPGLIPAAWLGGGLELTLGSRWQLAFSATAYAPAEYTDTSQRGAQLWGFHGGFGVCPLLLRNDVFDLRACGAAHLGALFASAVNLSERERATLPLMLVSLGPNLLFRLTDALSARLTIAAAWLAVRPRIHWKVEGEPDQTSASSQIVPLASFGITISLP